MPTVRVEPAGVEIDVAIGEAVAVAAWRLGYRWPTRCWGQADCLVCRVRVLEGDEMVAPPGADERAAMRRPAFGADRGDVRLGCRLQVTGEGVVLEKRGVEPPHP